MRRDPIAGAAMTTPVGAVYDRAQSLNEKSRAVIDRAYSYAGTP